MALRPAAEPQGLEQKELPRTCVKTLSGHTASVLVVRGNAAGIHTTPPILRLPRSCIGTLLAMQLLSNSLLNGYRAH
jgi:hypothetical protein